ncbi:class I SAM-dependent methyltransferase, partial [Patescibacteria group bacterium]
RHHDANYERTVERLKNFKNSTILKKKSMDALADFPDGSLDFVFIDADHRFQHITNDLAEWSKKVKIGGIISGHDFGEGIKSTDYVHVKSVVKTWTNCYKIHPWFVLNARHEESWMWVKTRELP